MQSVALRFAFRELRHGARALRGFGIFLGCLALGVAAIAGVQSTATSIVTGLRADGREILGGDLALRAVYQDLAPADRIRLERAAEAVTHFAEMRTMARRPGAAEAGVLVELKAVDGRYPLFGRVEAQGGDGEPVSLAAALGRGAGGRGTEGRGAGGRGAEGRGAEGRGAEGRDTEGQGAEGRDTEGQGAEGRDTEGRGAEVRDIKGRDTEGRGAEGQDTEGRGAGEWGALVDRALAERLALEEGDSLAIGGITLEVRGTIEREPDRAGSGGPFGFWPRVLVSLDALAASDLVREGSLVYHQYALRLAGDASLDAVRAMLGERFADTGWQMRTYEDAAPGIQRMVERLGSFLSLVGLTALLVGGVGVGNAVRAWLDTRLGVIAILKCIGAPRAVVFSTYLSQLTVIAGLGVLAGLAIGALAPVAAGGLLATLLPTPVALGIYPGVLVIATLFGLLTSVTFTLWPLSRAHETPAVALFRGTGLGVRPGRRGHLAAALAGGAALAVLAVASAPDRWFAMWFIGGAALILLVFRAAGWAVVRAARSVHRAGRPASEMLRKRDPAVPAASDVSGTAREGGPATSARAMPRAGRPASEMLRKRDPAVPAASDVSGTAREGVPATSAPGGSETLREHGPATSAPVASGVPAGPRPPPRTWLGPRLRMAISNLYRPGNATADVVLSLGLGLTVLVAVAQVEGNLRRDIVESLPEDAPAFFFIGVEADRLGPLAGTMAGIEGAGRFRSVPFLRGRIVRVKGLDPEEAMVRDEHAWLIQGDRGLSYATVAPDNPVVAGDWWPEDYDGPPLLSVDMDVIEAFDLALGDTITLNVLGREVAAEVRHVREVEWQGMQLNFALLLSPEPLRRAPHGYVATVGATPEAEARIERVLAREFPQVTVVRVREALGRVAELMGSIAAAARTVGGVTLLAGALVLAGTVAAGHRRRTYESVVLKVLGVRRRDVVLIHAAEFALLGLVTGAIAAVAGAVTAWAVTTRVLDQDWVLLPGAVAGTVGLCVLMTLGLGLFGTWRALGESASPYLRNE